MVDHGRGAKECQTQCLRSPLKRTMAMSRGVCVLLICCTLCGTAIGGLYGFIPSGKTYNVEVVSIDPNTGNTTTLHTIKSSDANCGTASKDSAGYILYNSIRALADNSFSLQGFNVHSGKRVFMTPLPAFVTQGDVGRTGAFVLTAYHPASDVVLTTGPTSFDPDGYFTAAVYKVRIRCVHSTPSQRQ